MFVEFENQQPLIDGSALNAATLTSVDPLRFVNVRFILAAKMLPL